MSAPPILPGYNFNQPMDTGALGALAAFMPGLQQGVNTLAQHSMYKDEQAEKRKLANQKQAMEGVRTLGEILKLPKNMRKPMIDTAVEKMGVHPDVGKMLAAADDEQAAGLVKELERVGAENPHATLAALGHDPVQVMSYIGTLKKEKEKKEEKAKWAEIFRDADKFGGAIPGTPAAGPPAPEPAPVAPGPAAAPGALPGPPRVLPIGGDQGGAIPIATPPGAARPGGPPVAPGGQIAPPPGSLSRGGEAQPQVQAQETYLRSRLSHVENQITALNNITNRAAAAGLTIDEDRSRALKLRLDALQGDRTSILAQIKELPKPEVEKDETDAGKLLANRNRIVNKAVNEGRELRPEELKTVQAMDRSIEALGVKKEADESTLQERVAKAEANAKAKPNDPVAQAAWAQAKRAWELHLESQQKTVKDPLDDLMSVDDARAAQLPWPITKRQALARGANIPITAATSGQKEAAGVSLKIIEELEGLSKKLHTSKGWVSRLTGAPSAIARQALQTDEDLVLYNSTSNAVLANFARIFGERGTLTDQDIDRARALIPKMWPIPDTKKTADRKLDLLRRLIEEVASRPAPGGGRMIPGKGGGPVTPATGQSSKDLKDSLGIEDK